MGENRYEFKWVIWRIFKTLQRIWNRSMGTKKKEETCLKLMMPQNPEKNNYLIYEIIEKSRFSGTVSDIDELLELCEETFGEDCIIKNNSNYYYGK